MLSEKGDLVRKVLIWAYRNDAFVKVSFKKGSKSRKMGRIRKSKKFRVSTITGISFFLSARGKVYPRRGEYIFLIEDVADIKIV